MSTYARIVWVYNLTTWSCPFRNGFPQVTNIISIHTFWFIILQTLLWLLKFIFNGNNYHVPFIVYKSHRFKDTALWNTLPFASQTDNCVVNPRVSSKTTYFTPWKVVKFKKVILKYKKK